jgi:Ni,Fe-hydrogenase III component G
LPSGSAASAANAAVAATVTEREMVDRVGIDGASIGIS